MRHFDSCDELHHLVQETRITRTHDEDGSYSTIKLPETETRNALLGNLFISDGEPGPVLKIDCRERIGVTFCCHLSHQSSFYIDRREELRDLYERMSELGLPR